VYSGAFSDWSIAALVRHAACCSLRREYLKDLLVKKPLDIRFRAGAVKPDPEPLRAMFHACIDLVNWGFGTDGDAPLVWKEDRWSMHYACHDGSFVVQRGSERMALSADAAADFARTHCTPLAFAAPESATHYALRLIRFLEILSP
jgi:hypothetical protein